jgi:hypothetical protein
LTLFLLQATILSTYRNLKQTLSKQYPKAFSACGEVYDVMETAEEEEISVSIPVPRSPAQIKAETSKSKDENVREEAESVLEQSKESKNLASEVQPVTDSKS